MDTNNEIYVKLIDLLISLVWPSLIIFLVFKFRSKVSMLLDNLIYRFKSTSKLELPGGVKAFFEKSESEIAEKVAIEITDNIGSKDNNDKVKIISTVQKILFNEKLNILILYIVSSRGMINRNNLLNIISNEIKTISNSEFEASLSNLITSKLLYENNGKILVTGEGIDYLRKNGNYGY